MIYSIIAAGINTVVFSLLTHKYIHIFQLEGYKRDEYSKYLKANPLPKRFFIFFLIALLVRLVLNMTVEPHLAFYIGEGCFVALSVILMIPEFSYKAKKPLVYTNRVKRQIVAIVLLAAIVSFGLEYLSTLTDVTAGLWGILVMELAPILVLAAGVITAPIEKGIQNRFIRDAKKILATRPDLIKIGITGSYGKTSTKFILGTILSEKYNVLVTPKSYNTPMGVVRVVREMLDIEHEVFISEMGARHVGDIQELCDIVHPKYGLITSVGKQHLETFGSLENIAKGKYELVENLPADGAAFFPSGNEITVEMYNKTEIEKYLFGAGGTIRAEDITVSQSGSTFTLVDGSGNSARCTTKLLGKYNIDNILGCVAVCLKLGMTLDEIARGIAKVRPVEHRLQLLNSGSITIIDDAFNSNPAGAQMALEVLSGFRPKRIIITPGMVELGEAHDEEHFKMGQQIATSVDVAILVGPKRTKPIYDGIMDKGFEGRVEVVRSLNEALELLKTLTQPGDTVLLENDLPDNYNE